MTKICPYSGEVFTPKRRDQVFASPRNRRDFHNQKAAELRELIGQQDKILTKNFLLLSELVQKGQTKRFEKEYLQSRGFDILAFTHLHTYEGTTLPCLYHFIFPKTENQNQIIVKNIAE